MSVTARLQGDRVGIPVADLPPAFSAPSAILPALLETPTIPSGQGRVQTSRCRRPNIVMLDFRPRGWPDETGSRHRPATTDPTSIPTRRVQDQTPTGYINIATQPRPKSWERLRRKAIVVRPNSSPSDYAPSAAALPKNQRRAERGDRQLRRRTQSTETWGSTNSNTAGRTLLSDY